MSPFPNLTTFVPRPPLPHLLAPLRTPASWAVAIAGAEYLTGAVPLGTHQWQRFISPEELSIMAGGWAVCVVVVGVGAGNLALGREGIEGENAGTGEQGSGG